MRILLVEDDESVAKALEKVLTDEHYTVDVADDGQAGWHLVNIYDYDLVVLDVVLPKLDGLELCQRLRECSYTMPVLLLTALDSRTKKLAGFNAGADDYITKPFELEELLARVRVLLRRVQTMVVSTLEWGQLRLDLNSREVNYGEIYLSLTPKEYGLLELFLRNPSQVFSRGSILDHLWSCSEAPGEDTVTSHIKGLRRKLTAAGAPSDLIKTVYGVGYRLRPAETDETPSAPAPEPEIELVTCRQKTQAALVTLWKSFKPQHLKRVGLLREATQALQTNALTDELKQAATQAAHSLTGALGIFGLKSGSDLARAIEKILRSETPIDLSRQQQLSELVNTLTKNLHQAFNQLEQSNSSLNTPLLVLIDNSIQRLQQLATALQAQDLNVDVAMDEAALGGLRHRINRAQSVLPKSSTRSLDTANEKPSLPDVVLFNVCLADLNKGAWARLSQLINQVPPLPILVSSADGSLTNRVSASQLGSHSFLHSTDISTLLSGVLEVRSHLQQPTNKVLAVDDDPQVLEALRTLLEPKGLQLITLNQPVDFWATLQSSSPDLLLLDMEMPDFSGIELCQAVRQAPVWNQLPIVFFTAHSDADAKIAALRAGANDLVDKSLAESDLFIRLCDQLRRVQLQQTMATLSC